jgi:hypothetical protein
MRSLEATSRATASSTAKLKKVKSLSFALTTSVLHTAVAIGFFHSKPALTVGHVLLQDMLDNTQT